MLSAASWNVHNNSYSTKEKKQMCLLAYLDVLTFLNSNYLKGP